MAATVLVVEDDEPLRDALCDTLELSGFRATGAADGRRALEVVGREDVGLVVSDVQMPDLDGIGLLRALRASNEEVPVLLMTAHGTVAQAVEAMHLGAADYLLKPFEADTLVGKVGVHLREPERGGDAEPVAADAASRELLALAERVAGTDVTVLLVGESGTGKEVFARHIHRRSSRSDGPFVAVNCAAIPDNMLEAVLFGYDKGAFTGAYKSSPGKFEQAQRGTVLLDEIGEMDVGLQAKLLRVLQEREVERLGSRESVKLDVRVIASTNRNLAESVADGGFREDLFFRLNVFPLRMPALRERPADIVPLAKHLLGLIAVEMNVTPAVLTEAAAARLRVHPWPGNVRELHNVLQRAMVLCAGGVIDDATLATGAGLDGAARVDTGGGPAVEAAPSPAAGGTLGNGLREQEFRLILDALETGHGSRKQAAEILGISPRTLRYKLAQMRDEGYQVPGIRG